MNANKLDKALRKFEAARKGKQRRCPVCGIMHGERTAVCAECVFLVRMGFSLRLQGRSK